MQPALAVDPHGPDGDCTCHETCPECSGDGEVIGAHPGPRCSWCGSGCCDVPVRCELCKGAGVVEAEVEPEPLELPANACRECLGAPAMAGSAYCSTRCLLDADAAANARGDWA